MSEERPPYSVPTVRTQQRKSGVAAFASLCTAFAKMADLHGKMNMATLNLSDTEVLEHLPAYMMGMVSADNDALDALRLLRLE